MSLANKDNR
ncbi:hypothetical protein VTL71DRAFT_3849 [Oculimacula yallundae]|uniref:Uncharacterized protein n=1 Tax=Oculimacula yallundae TaxID=86028 RepID=A0ABR4C5V5_9HELO